MSATVANISTRYPTTHRYTLPSVVIGLGGYMRRDAFDTMAGTRKYITPRATSKTPEKISERVVEALVEIFSIQIFLSEG